MRARSEHFVSLGLGAALGLCTLLPGLSWLSVLPLAALLAWAAPRDTARRLLLAGTLYTGVHLWWVMALVARIFGVPPAGALAWLIYAVEGAFFAVLGALVARLVPSTAGRIWALAGGWVLLEALRFLGPLALPWPTIGAAWLDTPLAQTADLWGVLGLSWLMTFTAAALASASLGRRRALWPMTGVLLAALGYGLTRLPADGPAAQAYVVRTDIDGFDRAHAYDPAQQAALLGRLSAGRRPGEPVIWPESSLPNRPESLALFPAPGLTGAFGTPDGQAANVALAVDAGGAVTAENHKGRPVPFGESFPFSGPLAPLYRVIGQMTGFDLSQSVPPATRMNLLTLDGVRYGAYVCYDSVFGWPARQLTAQGAEVLVNLSNDSWFVAAGVRQHFNLGRLRAIENRRWVLRSVMRGVAGSVNDLGQPVQLLAAGEGGLSAEYRRLNGRTVYNRFGDIPALLLAGAGVLYGLSRSRPSPPARRSAGPRPADASPPAPAPE